MGEGDVFFQMIVQHSKGRYEVTTLRVPTVNSQAGYIASLDPAAVSIIMARKAVTSAASGARSKDVLAQLDHTLVTIGKSCGKWPAPLAAIPVE